MLVWSPIGRLAIWGIAALLLAVLFGAPLTVIAIASLAIQWNGVLPTCVTLDHCRDILTGASRDAVHASLVTALLASLLALLSGTWAALALRLQHERWQRLIGLLFFVPSLMRPGRALPLPSITPAHPVPR